MMPADRTVRAVRRLLHTRYPGFVFGLPLRGDEIPVFTYHDVEPQALARDLEFLRDNGYRTLSLAEFTSAATARLRPGPAVLLTFDDARKSFWQVAFPLLRDAGAHAVLFAPTYWMGDPALREPGTDRFMSWAQLRACAESGQVEVQSHAHRHALVFTDHRLVEFASPPALARYDMYDWPMRRAGGQDLLGPPPLGTPIYRAAPLLSASRRFLESEEAARACRELVEREGGAAFFARSGWAARLTGLHAERGSSGRFLPAAEFHQLVASELERSRDEFQRHLGYAPRYLAYPWMLGSRHSLEVARSAGIRAAFGVALDHAAARDRSLPIPVFRRFKADWLRLLPGRGRASLLAAVGRKISSFGELQNLAH